jgi:hypothetical protein
MTFYPNISGAQLLYTRQLFVVWSIVWNKKSILRKAVKKPINSSSSSTTYYKLAFKSYYITKAKAEEAAASYPI